MQEQTEKLRTEATDNQVALEQQLRKAQQELAEAQARADAEARRAAAADERVAEAQKDVEREVARLTVCMRVGSMLSGMESA